MRYTNYSIASLLACCLLATGCSSEYEVQAPAQNDMTTLRINVYTPSSNSYTTRAEDTDPATDPERTMHDLKVWAFLSSQTGGDAVAVGYAFKSDLNQANEYQWLEMGLPKSVINQKLDFYAIANATGTGFEEVTALGYYPTRSAIESAKFTAFGTTNAVTGAVPKSGLPASRILKGVTPVTALESTPENPNRLSITLLRAVAKFRFFFAKPEGFEGQITKIELNENVLPSSELMMPAASTDNDVLPHTKAVTLPTGATRTSSTLTYATPLTNITALADANALESYVKTTNETFTTYVNRLANNLTEYTAGLTYIRESDAPLTGKIYYKIGDADTEEKSVDFVLQTEDMDDHGTDGTVHNCFPRNHYSVVYGYFKGDKELYVKPMVADWSDTDPLDYAIDMSTNMRLFDSWLYRYDIDGNYDDYTKWATSHIAVSSGRVETPVAPETVAGRPLRSPQIQLVTSGSGTFELTVDNSDFEIVRANKNDVGVVTSYDASADGKLTIGAGHDVYTYFYIVPKEGTTPANPVAKVSLIYNDPVLGPQKVTFNNNVLPGYSDDSSEIWVYYFPEAEYTIDGKLKMYYQNAANPLVPTPVQS